MHFSLQWSSDLVESTSALYFKKISFLFSFSTPMLLIKSCCTFNPFSSFPSLSTILINSNNPLMLGFFEENLQNYQTALAQKSHWLDSPHPPSRWWYPSGWPNKIIKASLAVLIHSASWDPRMRCHPGYANLCSGGDWMDWWLMALTGASFD